MYIVSNQQNNRYWWQECEKCLEKSAIHYGRKMNAEKKRERAQAKEKTRMAAHKQMMCCNLAYLGSHVYNQFNIHSIRFHGMKQQQEQLRQQHHARSSVAVVAALDLIEACACIFASIHYHSEGFQFVFLSSD